MLDLILARVLKPLVLFGATFFAVRAITASDVAAFVVGSIPLVLGAANIYTRLGTAVTAISLIALAALIVMPADAKQHVLKITHYYTNAAFTAVEKPAGLSGDAYTNSAAPPPKHGHKSSDDQP